MEKVPLFMNYRPEIDGLRSFAVIPVVLFHAGFTIFSGGVVGVDVFFVISGYLIARIIISEMRADRFSYLGFYERRIRRIMPALSIVVLVSLFASLLVSLPNHVEQSAASGISALFGFSNIYFWTQSGYFAPSSEFQVLLHTWSLGVEEQFYLLLPPVLFLLFRFGLSLRLAITICLPLLFLFGLWLSFNKPSVAFFLLPARAWELLVGVALAAEIFPKWQSRTGNSVLALVGLLAIVASVFVINRYMFFPGWVALLPCLGTAAVIYSASGENLTGRLLSFAPLRFIGLISYSLYLWHWPVLVILRMYFADVHLDIPTAIFGIVLSFVLAALTWRFVENPFRSRSTMRFRTVVVSLGAISLVSISISVASISASGFPERLDVDARTFAAASSDIDPLRVRCREVTDLSDASCWFGAADTSPSFVLVGDSHAGAIRPGIEAWANAQGRAGAIFWKAGCPMVYGATKVPGASSADCDAFKQRSIDAILKNSDINLVILAGRWEVAYTGVAPEVGGSFRTFWIDDLETERTNDTSQRVFRRALEKTAKTFVDNSQDVVFIGAVPEVGFDVPTMLALAAHNGKVEPIKKAPANELISAELDNLFEDISEELERVEYLSIRQEFCRPNCSVLEDGIPLYSDDDHLSLSGARDFMGPFLTVALQEKLSLSE